MAFALRLIFRRDLGCQFPDYGHTEVGTGYSEGHGHFLGSIDYTRLARIDRIADVQSREIDFAQEPQIGGSGDLILIPTGKHVDRTLLNTEVKYANCNLAFLIRGSLSSLAFDVARDSKQVTRLLGRAEKIVGAAALAATEAFHATVTKTTASTLTQFTPTSWYTLGGPDIVCLAFPESAADIYYLSLLTNTLRSSSLLELCKGIETNRNLPKGHAFSSLQSNLLYRNSVQIEATANSTSDFRRIEQQCGLSYHTRVSVGPGHETLVLDRIQHLLKDDRDAVVCIGHRSLLLRFQHIADLVNAIESINRPLKGNVPVRAKDVSAVRTTVGLPPETLLSLPSLKATPHDSPSLSQELSAILDRIHKSFADFSHRFLGPMSGTEFMQLSRSLSSAFRRNERATSVQDLLPFFMQLCRALETTDWTSHFSEPSQHPAFAAFNDLVRHLWRCIRNRVEHRVEPLDPAFPNTIEYGASKVINAYSVAAWLASCVLFNPPDAHPSQKALVLEHFAAAVSAGAADQVRVDDAFANISEDTRAGRGKGEWNSPLLMLDISGQALMQPEVTFVFCFHEIAEISHWTSLPHFGKLAMSLRDTLASSYTGQLCAALVQYGFPANAQDSEEGRNQLLMLRQAIESVDSSQVIDSLLSQFNDTLSRLTYERLARSYLIVHNRVVPEGDVANVLIPEWCDDLLGLIRSGGLQTFACEAKSVEALLNEVLADFAMTVGLKDLLRIDQRGNLARHVNFLFASLIAVNLPLQKLDKPRHLRFYLQRWLCQLHCVGSPDGRDPISWMKAGIDTNLSQIRGAYNGLEGETVPKLEVVLDEFYEQVRGNRQLQSLSGVLSVLSEHLDQARPTWSCRTNAILGQLANEFRELWHEVLDLSPGQESKIDRMRYDFLVLLWAQAQKLLPVHLFDVH